MKKRRKTFSKRFDSVVIVHRNHPKHIRYGISANIVNFHTRQKKKQRNIYIYVYFCTRYEMEYLLMAIRSKRKPNCQRKRTPYSIHVNAYTQAFCCYDCFCVLRHRYERWLLCVVVIVVVLAPEHEHNS